MRHSKRLTESVKALMMMQIIGAPFHCDCCKRFSDGCQLDRRVPGRFGGQYVTWNVHFLCSDCHLEKSALESTFGQSSRWFDLAFPNPTPGLAMVYCDRVLNEYEGPLGQSCQL